MENNEFYARENRAHTVEAERFKAGERPALAGVSGGNYDPQLLGLIDQAGEPAWIVRGKAGTDPVLMSEDLFNRLFVSVTATAGAGTGQR